VAEIQRNGSPMQIIPIKRPRILSEMDEIQAVKNPDPEYQAFITSQRGGAYRLIPHGILLRQSALVD